MAGSVEIQLRELNQHTSAVLRRVESGERLVVTNHGRPVARLVPIDSDRPGLDDYIAQGRLVERTISAPFVLPTVAADGVDVAAELAAERERERW